MLSRYLKRIFWVCVAVLVIFFAIAIIGRVVSAVPKAFSDFAVELSNTFYWSVPVIILLFLSPYVVEASRKPDIHFSIHLREDNSLLITLINKGDIPFSFNRIQFFIRKPRSSLPEHGKISVECQKPGEIGFGNYQHLKQDTGTTVDKGIPTMLLLKKESIGSLFNDLRKDRIRQPVYMRLYFEDTPLKAESTIRIPEDFIKLCAPVITAQNGNMEENKMFKNLLSWIKHHLSSVILWVCFAIAFLSLCLVTFINEYNGQYASAIRISYFFDLLAGALGWIAAFISTRRTSARLLIMLAIISFLVGKWALLRIYM